MRPVNIGVSVLCPGEVNTNITNAQRNRPEHLRRPRREGGTGQGDEARRRNAAITAALAEGMDPAAVAACVVDAIREDRFWVLSHPDYLADVRHRNEALHNLENPSLFRSLFNDE